MTAKKIISRFVSAFIIISIILPAVLFSTPQQVTAQGFVPVNDSLGNQIQTAILETAGGSLAIDNKGWLQKLGEQILKTVAKRILAQMTQATVNWINSGFHGSPLFLENPESFFKDIAKAQVKSLVDMIGYDTFRFPFGKSTALNVISSYKSQLETNSQYTLSKVINDPDLLRQYRNDFNYGGWNGFLINTQYPQNNYLGFNMIIQQNLASQLEGTLVAPAQKVQNALQQGMGFLSPQTCADNGGNNEYNKKIGNQFVRPTFKSNIEYHPTNDPGWEQRDQNYQISLREEKAEWAKDNTCKNLVNTTPGFVAATQISNALDSPRMMTVLDGALGNSFAAIFDALLNKLLESGLNALSSTINPSPEDANWSYEGQTLGGSNVTSSTAGGLNINIREHNVSLSLNVTTSATKTISGGIGPYSIQQPTFLNTSIATASITSVGVLTISATGNSGETLVKIKDSSDPARVTTINIEVNNPLVPSASPSAISTSVNDTSSVRISGGIKPYNVQTNSNQAVAITNLADNILIVSGVTSGTTEIVIRDSSNPTKTVTVPITIRESSTVSVAQESILLNPGNNTNNRAERGISFNNPDIINNIINSNPNVANVEVVGTTLIFTSKNITGQTKITARGPNHSIQNPQIYEFNITVAGRLVADRIRIYTRHLNGEYASALYSGGRYTSTISGGLAPYHVTGYTAGLFNQTPSFINDNTLFFELKSGIRGSSVSINIASSTGQIVSVDFTVN